MLVVEGVPERIERPLRARWGNVQAPPGLKVAPGREDVDMGAAALLWVQHQFLEVRRRPVAERRVEATGVVEALDEAEDQIGPGGVGLLFCGSRTALRCIGFRSCDRVYLREAGTRGSLLGEPGHMCPNTDVEMEDVIHGAYRFKP